MSNTFGANGFSNRVIAADAICYTMRESLALLLGPMELRLEAGSPAVARVCTKCVGNQA